MANIFHKNEVIFEKLSLTVELKNIVSDLHAMP